MYNNEWTTNATLRLTKDKKKTGERRSIGTVGKFKRKKCRKVIGREEKLEEVTVWEMVRCDGHLFFNSLPYLRIIK